MNPVAVELIKRWEGCVLTSYPDPATGAEPYTIGYGATGPGIVKGVRWTKEQADRRLEADIAIFTNGVKSALKSPATQKELGAMTSLAFNVGLNAFKNSTLVKMFNAGAPREQVADQFLRWNKANGKVMKGLSNRRADERKVFLS